MAVRMAQIAVQVGSALPKDQMVITPHYSTTGGVSDQALADSLKAKLLAHTTVGNLVPFTIKVYDAEAPPPHYPLGSASNVGTTPRGVASPRELALCLSYYAGLNRPRFRGRLYIPAAFMTTAVGLRPTQGQIDEAISWGAMLWTNLPSNVLGVVWSRVDKLGRNITNYWVDDEWDVVRSRGGRSTARTLGTVP